MSRRKRAGTRTILADPKYKNIDVAKFINNIMLDGKKSVAEGIFYGALETAATKVQKDELEFLYEVLDKVKPTLEVKSRRIGGATYPIPIEVQPKRQYALAMRWIINSSRKRAKASMENKLANEFLDIAENRGGALKKRDEVHKQAEANKAFSHFRF